MADAKIDDEVADILRRSTITETLLVLPPGRIEFYAKVKKALEAAGGKWNRSAQGFIFKSDPREKLGLALETGKVVDEKKLRQAFYTPVLVANRVAEHADVRGKTVLEPSAGEGALARACWAAGAAVIYCIEIEPSCLPALERITGAAPTIGDFLELPAGEAECGVMNPPFAKGQALRHIQRALLWLKAGAELYSIVPDNDCPKLAELGAEVLERFPAGMFKESGTGVATRLIRIIKRAPRRRV